MKKTKILGLILLSFFLGIGIVNAACTSEENINLSKAAYNIKPSYEAKEAEYEGEVDPPDGEEDGDSKVTYFYHKIYIANVTEDLYIKVTDSIDKETKTFTYKDAKDGVISFDWYNLWEITQFTIEVYSSDKTNCPNTKLYTTYLTTPLYNDFSTYEICSGLEDFYLCYQYLSVPQVDFKNFIELTNKYKNGLIDKDGNEIKKEEEKGFMAFVKKHKAMIGVTAMVVIVTGGIVTVIIVRKQRRVI